SDGYSYYVYLPATFIYGDPSLEALSRDWYGGAFPDFTAIRRFPSTGRWLDACPVGAALLMFPFFGVGHLLSWWSNLPRDGFSFYYQHAAGLAGVTYFLCGLAIVRSMLRQRFSEGVALATLVALTWGTNLFHYGTFDATFSHASSFFLICGWIALVDRWWERPAALRSAGLGALAGLIVLTRNLNAIFLLVLPLYGIATLRDMRRRIGVLWQRRAALTLGAIGILAAVTAAVGSLTDSVWPRRSSQRVSNGPPRAVTRIRLSPGSPRSPCSSHSSRWFSTGTASFRSPARRGRNTGRCSCGCDERARHTPDGDRDRDAGRRPVPSRPAVGRPDDVGSAVVGRGSARHTIPLDVRPRDVFHPCRRDRADSAAALGISRT